MDVDNDIDGQLMQQFLSMGTQDREVLVKEFQKFLNNQLNTKACIFYLDMNNWNLQAAIGSYYDHAQEQTSPLALMVSVDDITFANGEAVCPKADFQKTWKITNTGVNTWPPGCSLKFLLGHQLGAPERVMVEALSPNGHTEVSVTMKSPSLLGMYHSQWRMCSPTGTLFGDVIWVIVSVSEDGILDVTQRMSNFGADLANRSPKQNDVSYNPFNSPSRITTHTPHDMQTVNHSTASFTSDPAVVKDQNSFSGTAGDVISPTSAVCQGITFETMDDDEML